MADPSIHYLTLEEMKEICFSLVQELLQFTEPVPEFETRFPEKLESILETSQQTFNNVELYPTIFSKAACYYYFIIKNHPFLNGNKRLAIVATYVFLRINGYKLSVPLQTMYSFAVRVANSTVDHKKEFQEVELFIKRYTNKL